MEGILILFVYVLIAAAAVGGLVYVCKSFNVPQIGQWFVAACIITILLFGLIHFVNGTGPHLPKW